MGNKNSGSRPQPTALKILFARPERLKSDPKLEPAPASFDTPAPEIAGDPIAVLEWVRVVPQLREVGLITSLERGALISLCQQWSRYLAAERDIAVSGMVIYGESGPKANPSVLTADRALTQCLSLWRELGMTPVGRSKMVAIVKRETVQRSKWATTA